MEGLPAVATIAATDMISIIIRVLVSPELRFKSEFVKLLNLAQADVESAQLQTKTRRPCQTLNPKTLEP